MKPVYKSRDGEEHDTEAEATARDELLGARDAFAEAADNLSRLLLANARTADGEPFNARSSRYYWHVATPYMSVPRLCHVDVWPHQASVDCDHHTGAALAIRTRSFDGRKECEVVYKFAEIYAHKKNAVGAFLVAVDEWLARMHVAAVEAKAAAVEAAK